MFFLWLPMYWAHLNFKVWVIWASVTLLLFHKWLESFQFICCRIAIYLHMEILFRAIPTSWLSCAFATNVCKFLMASSCVAVGQLASQQGVA